MPLLKRYFAVLHSPVRILSVQSAASSTNGLDLDPTCTVPTGRAARSTCLRICMASPPSGVWKPNCGYSRSFNVCTVIRDACLDDGDDVYNKARLSCLMDRIRPQLELCTSRQCTRRSLGANLDTTILPLRPAASPIMLHGFVASVRASGDRSGELHPPHLHSLYIFFPTILFVGP